ncbi:MAG TPA: hypothetical protein VLE72_01770 [Candidatus Saccharimonadales bacterium]|nr:hypothetical protein [Candidatus Saccharimonadales bacterium]
MAKSKNPTLIKLDRSRLAALVGLILAIVFMVSVTDNVSTKIALGGTGSPNSYAGLPALAAVALSYWWDRRLRLLTAFTLGIMLASYYIWQFGLHFVA